MHYFSTAFLMAMADQLKQQGQYHIAHKKIPSKDGPVQVADCNLHIHTHPHAHTHGHMHTHTHTYINMYMHVYTYIYHAYISSTCICCPPASCIQAEGSSTTAQAAHAGCEARAVYLRHLPNGSASLADGGCSCFRVCSSQKCTGVCFRLPGHCQTSHHVFTPKVRRMCNSIIFVGWQTHC